MSNSNFKIIENFGDTKKSERRKYLETMMADMGIVSMDELSPEEQGRWLAACRPDPMVEKKLIEMGYSINTNTNKRSLGRARGRGLNRLYKIANLSQAASEYGAALTSLKGILTYHDVDPSVFIEIENLVTSEIQNKNFNYYSLENEVNSIIMENTHSILSYSFFVETLLDKASQYNSEYLKSTGAFDNVYSPDVEASIDLGSGVSIGRNHEDRDQVAFIQQSLADLGYPLERFGVDGKFGPETEGAIVLFQEQNNLPKTGVIDDATLRALKENPVPLSEEIKDKYKSVYSNLNNLSMGSHVDIVSVSPIMHEYLNMLNSVAGSFEKKVVITSAFRGPYDQARVMYNNYKRRGVGSARANSYFRRLYGNRPGAEDIVSIFGGSADEEQKRIEVAKIVDSLWSKKGHGGGYSLDIAFSGGKQDIQNILVETQDMATVDILDEQDHFHVTVRSLTPGGIAKGKVRRFRERAAQA
jgi:hypothetical protein